MTTAILEGGDLTCDCGNQAWYEGFYPCDNSGNIVEPDAGGIWDSDYKCERCNAIYTLSENDYHISLLGQVTLTAKETK